ncbi:hypothetical protein KJ068_14495 [bacterium]|nr:hypothetical protein [bacterium]
MNSQLGVMLESYRIKDEDYFNPASPNLEIKPEKKGWLYISAETNTPNVPDQTQMAEDEKMTLILGNGNIGSQQINFEEIQLAPEFAIKDK